MIKIEQVKIPDQFTAYNKLSTFCSWGVYDNTVINLRKEVWPQLLFKTNLKDAMRKR